MRVVARYKRAGVIIEHQNRSNRWAIPDQLGVLPKEKIVR